MKQLFNLIESTAAVLQEMLNCSLFMFAPFCIWYNVIKNDWRKNYVEISIT